jgi:hypothetical protein
MQRCIFFKKRKNQIVGESKRQFEKVTELYIRLQILIFFLIALHGRAKQHLLRFNTVDDGHPSD